MCPYEITLTPRSPVATPFYSGTLFGHLCWAYRYRAGEAVLGEWLDQFTERPLLLSDALPTGYLPRPLVAPLDRAQRGDLAGGGNRQERIAGHQRLKQWRKRPWITVDDWRALRGGYSDVALYRRWMEGDAAPAAAVVQVRPHNRIDRQRGTTPESGGLYFVETRAYARDRQLTAYAATDHLGCEEIQALFDDVGRFGYGRDATTGLGQFTAEVRPYQGDLFDHAGPRRLSLSHGCIDATTPNPRYQLHTHYGRLGGTFAQDNTSPFKRPVLLAEPGATFDGRDGLAGALLRGVHAERPEIRQHAYHLCLPFTEGAV
jgi:CRISPR-associated protein Csm4